MRLILFAVLIGGLWCPAQEPASKAEIVIPAGTKVILDIARPVPTKSVQLGDSIYAATAFPVTVNGALAIPAGTDVKGRIEIMTLPRSRSERAELRIAIPELVFAGGYVAGLQDGAFATVNELVSARSGVLLEVGTQIEMTFERPVTLDAAKVAVAAQRAEAAGLVRTPSAAPCVPIPGTSGTPSTFIPGMPGTPGTPPTVIPGGAGAPDIVIPGTPPTPETPPTFIPGTPGTRGIPCPHGPIVVNQPAPHKEAFRLKVPVNVAGRQLAAGKYDATWDGLGPVAQVRILRKGQLVAAAPARVVALGKAALATNCGTSPTANGSVSLKSIEFAGRTFGVQFD
jgi:hypothetical protein